MFNGHCLQINSKKSIPEQQSIRYKTVFIKQQVDHFSYGNNDVFDQRVLINSDYFEPYGPVFFYTGNEGDITWFCNNTGFLWDIAEEFNAALIFAEHRYYGLSLPYGNQSYKDPQHLGHLTSEQALADYSVLIDYLRNEYGKYFAKSPFIAFGGSYGGMLASWMRMKYPASVIGALAASAPIFQFEGLTDCGVFYKTVTKAYERFSMKCVSNIRKSWQVINKIGSTTEGRKYITKKFSLCKPLTTVNDVAVVKGWLFNTWTNLAMMNYPYKSNFMEPLPAWPVKRACSYLNKSLDHEVLIDGIAKAVKLYYNYRWFQSCTEMVMPMCSNGIDDMFERRDWNLKEFCDGCTNKFKVKTRPFFVVSQYGGRNISAASNIIFSNGDLDPWSGGGVLNSPNPSIHVILIKDGAHHLDLRFSNKDDPDSVKQARKREIEIIQQWLKDYWQNLKEKI
ncbi:DgyrCDS8774 [Dimorphilus gyrociliatus]|uniref:Lysosomal Pro-X carboxypeptidase n=1 Tax=Dimorphilus gyrociliatus TaxID=2664684 RepID=A0A7I8VV32_9ANNE|nr:DgyrCDS8774 [Dimorphilus gyrociliatus]